LEFCVPSLQGKEALESPVFECPTLGELVGLYTDLSEVADPETLRKIVESAKEDPDQNICVVTRTKSKVLVGFLRAWMDTEAKPEAKRGVVYDIVVSPSRRGEHIAEDLLEFLKSQKPA
jgi:ribosomal protein S18 acetylase RimI-like enzyme